MFRESYQQRCVSNQISNTPFPIVALFDFIGRNSQYREKEKYLIFYNNKYWFHLMCVKSSCAITQPCTYLTNWFQIIKSYSAKYQMVSIQIWCILFEMVIWQCFYWIWYWDFQKVHDLVHISGPYIGHCKGWLLFQLVSSLIQKLN